MGETWVDMPLLARATIMSCKHIGPTARGHPGRDPSSTVAAHVHHAGRHACMRSALPKWHARVRVGEALSLRVLLPVPHRFPGWPFQPPRSRWSATRSTRRHAVNILLHALVAARLYIEPSAEQLHPDAEPATDPVCSDCAQAALS